MIYCKQDILELIVTLYVTDAPITEQQEEQIGKAKRIVTGIIAGGDTRFRRVLDLLNKIENKNKKGISDDHFVSACQILRL
jgi:hypothetical protein